MEQGKLGYIDAARGIAILMVVLVHHTAAVAKIMPLGDAATLIGGYGQMGVQLFFVASALTLCMSQSRRGGQSLGDFYLRRFFRIAPLYYVGIILYALIDLVAPREGFGAYTAGNILANLTFVHGFVPSAINDVVPGGWSIGGEMAFYAVFPFLFAAADAAFRKWGALPIVAFAGLLVALYVGAWHVIPLVTPFEITRNNIFYYWAPAHVVVFCIGIAAFFLTRNGERWPAWVDLVGLLGLTAGSLALWRSGYTAAFAIIPSCSAVSFVFLIQLLARLRFDPERRSMIERIGVVSYSMYVWHFVVVWFATPLILEGVAGFIPSSEATLITTFPVTVLMSFTAAYWSHKGVEQVGQDLGKRVIRRSRRRPAVA